VTDHTLARADEVLTELVELVETARTLPMSSSCVVPRERTLDLLDALREVLPPEMVEARRIVLQRERLLSESSERAEQLVKNAQDQAANLLAEAKAEQAELVSAAAVHRQASIQAEQLTARASAEADQLRARAEEYATALRADAQSYADRTLSEVVANLTRLTAIAENGRAALSAPD